MNILTQCIEFRHYDYWRSKPFLIYLFFLLGYALWHLLLFNRIQEFLHKHTHNATVSLYMQVWWLLLQVCFGLHTLTLQETLWCNFTPKWPFTFTANCWCKNCISVKMSPSNTSILRSCRCMCSVDSFVRFKISWCVISVHTAVFVFFLKYHWWWVKYLSKINMLHSAFSHAINVRWNFFVFTYKWLLGDISVVCQFFSECFSLFVIYFSCVQTNILSLRHFDPN